MKKMTPQMKLRLQAYTFFTVFGLIVGYVVLKIAIATYHDMNKENELKTKRQYNELYEWDYKQKHKDDK